MKPLILTLFFLLLNITSGFLFADTFTKHGDNGTASCNRYCAGLEWSGGIGSCVSAHNGRDDTAEKCDAVPGFLNGKELTCECESGKLPIRATRRDTVGSHWYMETDVTVSASGLISANTETKSCQTKGFTGGVWVALLDQDTNVLQITGVQSYGVEGKDRVPGSPCKDRTAPWSETIPTSQLKNLGGIVIYHSHDPNVRVTKEDVYEAIKVGADIYTATQTGGL